VLYDHHQQHVDLKSLSLSVFHSCMEVVASIIVV